MISRMNDATLDSSAASLIHRGDIVERVLQRPAVRVFLMHAPAGCGKTAALSQVREHLASQGTQTAWITCSLALRTQADVQRALASQLPVVQALTAAEPGDSFARLLARLRGPIALFIDNADTALDASLREVLRMCPDILAPGVSLFWASRRPFAFADEKLMLDSRVHVFDAGDLRFTQEQSQEFLRRHLGWGPARAKLDVLADFAGGWPAVLRLLVRHARLLETMPSADWPGGVAGSEIGRYVRDEVLAGYCEDQHRELLRISVLHALSPKLCAVVTGTADAGALLTRLWEDGLVDVSPMERGVRQQLHRVVRHCLQRELIRREPTEMFRLHRLAATWYAEEAQPLQAIAHALQGRDFAFATSLLVVHGRDLLEGGRMRRLGEWLDQLPDYCITGSIRLQLMRVWSTCFTDGPQRALQHLRAFGLHDSTDTEIMQHCLALRTLALSMSDQHEEARAAGVSGLARLPTQAPFADTILVNALANVHWILGEVDKAEALFKPRCGASTAMSGFGAMYAFAIEGAVDLVEGRLRQAKARLSLALANDTASEEQHEPHGRGNAWAGVMYASCIYEAGEHRAAAALLDRHLEIGRGAGQPEHLSLGLVLRSRIAWGQDEPDLALALLNELESAGARLGLPRLTAAAELERARQYTERGRVPAAVEAIARAESLLDWDRYTALRLLSTDLDFPRLARWRLEVLHGSAANALQALDAQIALAESQRRSRRALKLRVIRCGALWRTQDASTFAAVKSVLKDGCAEGYVSLLAEEHQSIRDPLRAFSADPEALALKKNDPIVAEYLVKLLDLLQIGRGDGAPRLDTGLSVKEIRTLRLLAEGHSNKTMADKLFLSNSTVRTHLRSINAKLGSHTRTEAVAIGRRLGLIE